MIRVGWKQRNRRALPGWPGLLGRLLVAQVLRPSSDLLGFGFRDLKYKGKLTLSPHIASLKCEMAHGPGRDSGSSRCSLEAASVTLLLSPLSVGLREQVDFPTQEAASITWKAGQWVLHSVAGDPFGRGLTEPYGERPGFQAKYELGGKEKCSGGLCRRLACYWQLKNK